MKADGSAKRQAAIVSATANAYRAALTRLLRGEGRHPKHAGKLVRVTPAAVAREARRSRNPLYTTHRAILEEIVAATEPQAAARDMAGRIAELQAANRALREQLRVLTREQQALATENLALLHRMGVSEARLALRSSSRASQPKRDE